MGEFEGAIAGADGGDVVVDDLGGVGSCASGVSLHQLRPCLPGQRCQGRASINEIKYLTRWPFKSILKS